MHIRPREAIHWCGGQELCWRSRQRCCVCPSRKKRSRSQPPPDYGGSMSESISPNDTPARPIRALRIAGLALLLVVLALAFAGHLSPEMKLQWENLMALCGF